MDDNDQTDNERYREIRAAVLRSQATWLDHHPGGSAAELLACFTEDDTP